VQKKIRKNPAQALEVMFFQRGWEILPEGDENPFFFVILSGQVVLSRNGNKVRTLGEQDVFGLENLLLRIPSPYSAEAAQKCRIARYGPETLDYYISESPRMTRNVLVSILHQLTQTSLNVNSSRFLLMDRERIRFYKDGEVILEEEKENTGTEICRLISTQGGLQVTTGGQPVTLINKPGEFFGPPISLANFCVRSIGESVVEKYGADDLDIIVRDYPESACLIMRTMIERLLQSDV
jgi:hypothetical protein